MAERRILIASADEQFAKLFCQALGPEWVVVGGATGPLARAEMQRQPCDVVIADLDLPEMNGAELLEHIRIAYPTALRFLAATDAQKQQAMCHVAGGNQFLAKPFDSGTIKTTIERCQAANSCIINSSMREMIGRIRAFPTIPSLYLEVVSALNDPAATTDEIGVIVAKDMAMTTQLLQMLNSAYFSLPQTITDPSQAVGLLGFETVKSLVISIKLRNQYDKLKPIYFSIDNVWRHSTNVARLAKEIALLEGDDADIASAAYTAGLLHDLGKIILAANFDGQYNGAHAIARKNQVALCEVESDIFGANHGELAAYLFGLWGMPQEVIDAAALHHHPSRSADKSFTALTAIHVANALEHESTPDPDGLPHSMVDMTYLRQIGLEHRLADWRRALGYAPLAEPEVQGVKAAPAQKKAAAPAQPTGQLTVPWGLREWLFVGLGVTAALALLCWVESRRVETATEQVSNQPITNNIAPTPAPAVVHTPPPAPLVAAAKPPPPEPIAILAQTPSPAPVPEVAKPVPTEDTAFTNVTLQGIFYSKGHPSAIINGKTAQVSDRVSDFLVVDISPNSVTVEHENHRKTLTLR